MTTRVSGGMHPIIRHGAAGLIRGLAGLLASKIEGHGRRRRVGLRRRTTGGMRLIRRPAMAACGYRRRRVIRRRPIVTASGLRRRVGRPRIHRRRAIGMGGAWVLPGRGAYARRRRPVHRRIVRRRRIIMI